MSTYGSDKVAFFCVGGRSFLNRVGTFAYKIANGIVKTTPLGVANPTKDVNGLEYASLIHDGWFDDGVGSVAEACEGARGRSTQVVCFGVADNVLGRGMVGMAGAFVGEFKRILQVGDKVKAAAEFEVSGQVDDNAVILQPQATITAAGNTEATPVNNTASSASGGSGYLVVSALALGGYTNLVVKVRHSPDNITYADLLTFTVVTTSPTAERKTVAGTVDQYLATSRAWTGAGTGQSANILVGFARN